MYVWRPELASNQAPGLRKLSLVLSLSSCPSSLRLPPLPLVLWFCLVSSFVRSVKPGKFSRAVHIRGASVQLSVDQGALPRRARIYVFLDGYPWDKKAFHPFEERWHWEILFSRLLVMIAYFHFVQDPVQDRPILFFLLVRLSVKYSCFFERWFHIL